MATSLGRRFLTTDRGVFERYDDPFELPLEPDCRVIQFDEALTPDSSLGDYLDYIKPGSPFRQRALEEARLVTDRQEQAEKLIRDGMLVWLGDLWQLDIAPTPSLCDAFAARLQKEAEADRGKGSYWVVVEYLEIHLENLKWLASAHCDLKDAIAAVETTARGYPETPQRDRFLAALAQLPQP